MASLFNLDHPVPSGWIFDNLDGTYAVWDWTCDEFIGIGNSVLQYNNELGLYAVFNQGVIIGAGLFGITTPTTEAGPSISTHQETPLQNNQQPQQQGTKRKNPIEPKIPTKSNKRRRTPNILPSNLPSQGPEITPDQPLSTNMAAGPGPSHSQPVRDGYFMTMNQAPYPGPSAGQMRVSATPPLGPAHPAHHPQPQMSRVMPSPIQGHLQPGYIQPENLQPGRSQPGYIQPENLQPGRSQPKRPKHRHH
ncbi:hypothetical protein F5B17DRAFT_430291 [Nemania serpens]|nr:hypothetical protein F5B17DRAFT_430291 [Nemania serpens]